MDTTIAIRLFMNILFLTKPSPLVYIDIIAKGEFGYVDGQDVCAYKKI